LATSTPLAAKPSWPEAGKYTPVVLSPTNVTDGAPAEPLAKVTAPIAEMLAVLALSRWFMGTRAGM